MLQLNDKIIDVLIAGAGPAGLMMASQLALHHISFRIIDSKKSPSIHSGALIIHARTLEVFQQMGLAEKVLEVGIIPKEIKIKFNSRKLYSLNIDDFGKGLTPFPYMLILEQWHTENILQQFIKENGHYVENEKSLIDFSLTDNTINSEISNSEGTTEIIKSKFLIGADGKDSFVRQKLQIPFSGMTQDSKLFISDCKVNMPFSGSEILFSFKKNVTAGFFPLKGERRRVDGLIPILQHKDVAFDDVQQFFDNELQGEIKLSHPSWFSVFRSHSRCADSFYRKKCFLIGDAAHVHSPVGAQGMNNGIQDAYNLAWKLAYYIHGEASEKLLNSYQVERKPVALNTIQYTDLAYSFMTSNNFLKKFSRLYIFPLVLSTIIRLFRKNNRFRNRIFSAISGIGIKYKLSGLSSIYSAEGFKPHAPKPGDRLPYITYKTINGQISLDDNLTPSHFCLYVFGRNTLPPAFQNLLNKYENIITVKYLSLEQNTRIVFDKLGINDVGYYLIRPDQYIACRSHEFNDEVLNNYLQKILK